MKTRTNLTIKTKTNGGMSMDITYPKGTNVKSVVLDLVNWVADDDLDNFQAKINERIEFIKLNN